MSAAQDKIQASAKRLRNEIAELEATLGDKRAKLAVIEAKLNGEPEPLTGLDLLWEAALPTSRNRSSKHQCRVAWNRIPKDQRPPISVAVAALKKWNQCEDWKKDAGAFAKGLHLFISYQLWESVPEDPQANRSRYRSAPPPARPHEPLEIIAKIRSGDTSARQELARLLSIEPS